MAGLCRVLGPEGLSTGTPTGTRQPTLPSAQRPPRSARRRFAEGRFGLLSLYFAQCYGSEERLNTYTPAFEEAFAARMRARLGLHRKTDDDRSLVDALPEEDDLAAPPGEEPLGYKTFCGT